MLGGLKNFQNVLSLGVELVHSYGYGFFQILSEGFCGRFCLYLGLLSFLFC